MHNNLWYSNHPFFSLVQIVLNFFTDLVFVKIFFSGLKKNEDEIYRFSNYPYKFSDFEIYG